MTYYKDISGRRSSAKVHLDEALNKILLAMGNYADKKMAKDEQLILSTLNNLSNNASKWTLEEQFETAFDTVQTAKDNVYGDVSQAIVSNYEQALNAEHANFTADNFIANSLVNTKSLLSNLNFENQSDNIAEITSILDGISTNYRNDASTQSKKQLDGVRNDLNDAIALVSLFDLKDDDPEDDVWTMKNSHIKWAQSLDAFKSQDFSKAKNLADSAIVKDWEVVWQNAGDSYRRGLAKADDLSKAIVPLLDIPKDKPEWFQWGITGYMNILDNEFGTQRLNRSNSKVAMDEILTGIDSIIGSTWNKDTSKYSINWELSDQGKSLRDSYLPGNHQGIPTGGLTHFYATLNVRAQQQYKLKNVSDVTDRHRVDYLKNYVQFATACDDCDTNLNHNEAANKVGAEYFLELINIYRDLQKNYKISFDLIGFQ